jgi:hypothetical protein
VALVLPSAPPPPDASAQGPYTGLVVDARQLGLKRSICPLVLTESGKMIYGRFPDMTPAQLRHAGEVGIVGYLMDPGMIGDSRAGKHPLVVRALRVEGSNQGNAVLAEADGERILAEDRKAKFLGKMNVALLK